MNWMLFIGSFAMHCDAFLTQKVWTTIQKSCLALFTLSQFGSTRVAVSLVPWATGGDGVHWHHSAVTSFDIGHPQ